MIKRIKIKDNHLFKDIELYFEKNLIVFSGISGSGKSVFINLLLTLFGYKDEDASLIESTIKAKLPIQKFGIENEDENILRRVTQKSTRYFINGSQLSKKNILAISKNFINYLNLKEFNEFENKNLINLLDIIAIKEYNYCDHDKKVKEFKIKYNEYKKLLNKLKNIEDEEKKIEDLKEFAKYEIKKIETINPKIGEYDKLIELKKKLSKKEKIENAIENAFVIYEYENKVIDALNLLDEDSSFFTEALNELNIKLQNAKENLNELEEIDIEELLDRLEALSSLKNRYGSIEESIKYLEEKKKELSHYENISFEKTKLQKEIKELEKSLTQQAKTISNIRQKAINKLNNEIKNITQMLFLKDIIFTLKEIKLYEYGHDEVNISLSNTSLQKVSSGELNRIRLAFLAISSDYIQNNGILILDEIDANLSGKESTAIAKVLKKLSKNYQIFAISHQPQLSSFADEHYIVLKQKESSTIKKINHDQRILEVARMISGESISNEAKEFAKKLLKESCKLS